MKKIKILLLVFTGVILMGELVGRYYGLTDFPLYNSSDEFEYLLKPNQDVRIYRNHFVTNAFSMRSAPISARDTIIVLLLGDSVLNGGNLIDQDSLASTILEKELLNTYHKPIRVLNISDKTWSPDNIVAYLKKFGVFNADMFLLVANSGDAFDPMTFKPIVGVASTHPSKNAVFAWEKIIEKAWPIIEDKFSLIESTSSSIPEPDKKTYSFINGFAELDSLSQKLGIPFYIYLHQAQSELAKNQIDLGGKMIVEFCKKRNIPVTVNKLDYSCFDDEIHLNTKGQKAIAGDLLPLIQKGLKL
ncbi:hypothetical protein GCM10027347_31900 [Larkinella harenae]